ncbi:hypothetical protein HNP38_001876 [Chryseobacterium defluvii]|uniref:Uncharacterized protein n=1 Tax=Chryseobacterium defluvii TaxID=160396 RepID=A0A840KGE8_9FLAO|nr:hypothetical protein [Chryseobacterium defluvii]MBB4806580.1 hypothetical protein [Chryseobacterium defluvii]
MKNIFYLFLLVNSQLCFAQIGLGVNAQSFYERLYFKNNQYDYKDIKGSPYLNTEFQLAQIGDYKDIPARYNSYTDSFEFKKDGQTYIVPKEDNLGKIVFQNSAKTFVLLNLDGVKTYLEEVDKEVVLLKKITTTFKDFKKASTSYEEDVPASFVQQPPKYFLLNDRRLVEATKKSLSNSFPEKEKSLKDFVKKKNLSYDKESDLIKIVSFLKDK